MKWIVALALVIAPATLRAADAPPFELREGDRVLFIGDTFAEREAASGYLETLLTTRYPDRNVIFRSIGLSADDVFGVARSGFDGQQKGFERLVQVTKEVKPTVLFITYGMAESFAGAEGLPNFEKGMATLLDSLKDLNARTVLIGPIKHEDMGLGFPNPAQHNASLRLYADTLKKIADARGFLFVDLYTLLSSNSQDDSTLRLTSNGIHLTPYGYWQAARAVERGLGLPGRDWTVTLAVGGDAKAEGVTIADAKVSAEGATFRTTDEKLPPPPLPSGSPKIAVVFNLGRTVKITGLAPGKYVLKCGEQLVAEEVAENWAKGQSVVGGELSDHAEKIRQLAAEKNFQFFNQWRAANWTYIFGFREREQGRNKAEMPQFDKPIADREAEIAKLRVAGPQTYTLVKQ